MRIHSSSKNRYVSFGNRHVLCEHIRYRKIAWPLLAKRHDLYELIRRREIIMCHWVIVTFIAHAVLMENFASCDGRINA